MSDTPKVRFKGFVDAWEQCKLGEILQTLPYKEYIKTPEQNGKYEIIQQGNEPIIGFADGTPCSDYKDTVIFGDHTLSLYKPNRPFFVATDGIRIVKGKQYIDGFFLMAMLEKYKPQSEGYKRYYSILADSDCCFTEDDEEQCKIGELFEHLDNLITLHQHKRDETIEIKKYMLQKMFPQKGKKIPEIRFAGFTEDWEQCKVTGLGEIYIGLVTTMTAHYTNQGTLLIRNSDIKDSRFEFGKEPIYLEEDFAKKNASRKHKVGDVITVHTGDIGTSAVITEKEAGSIGFATIVTRPNIEKILSEYLCVYLNTDIHKNFALGISTGDGRNNYNLKDYYECVVPVPCINEQKKISESIRNLNGLITFHQRKCDELKEVKKFMLQNMFPQKG